MATENASDARLGNDDAEFLELIDDAEISPAQVLPRQASEGTDDRSIRPGEAGTAGLALKHGQPVA
jgi:hypothetical protein